MAACLAWTVLHFSREQRGGVASPHTHSHTHTKPVGKESDTLRLLAWPQLSAGNSQKTITTRTPWKNPRSAETCPPRINQLVSQAVVAAFRQRWMSSLYVLINCLWHFSKAKNNENVNMPRWKVDMMQDVLYVFFPFKQKTSPAFLFVRCLSKVFPKALTEVKTDRNSVKHTWCIFFNIPAIVNAWKLCLPFEEDITRASGKCWN